MRDVGPLLSDALEGESTELSPLAADYLEGRCSWNTFEHRLCLYVEQKSRAEFLFSLRRRAKIALVFLFLDPIMALLRLLTQAMHAARRMEEVPHKAEKKS